MYNSGQLSVTLISWLFSMLKQFESTKIWKMRVSSTLYKISKHTMSRQWWSLACSVERKNLHLPAALKQVPCQNPIHAEKSKISYWDITTFSERCVTHNHVSEKYKNYSARVQRLWNEWKPHVSSVASTN